MNADDTASFDAQYEALRSGHGLTCLTDWSSVTLTGADRQPFLNNFCTNDVKRLAPNESCEAFFCNVKGKIIGHGLITSEKDQLLIVGPPSQRATLASHLDRYVIREDVQIADTTLARPNLFLTVQSSNYHREWQLIEGAPAALLELDRADVQGRVDALVKCGWVDCGLDVFHALRIEAGTPLFGVDFDDRNFPQEVGRDEQAISFTKGCYLGQETVARIDALGHVNQRIAGIAFSEAEMPPAGTVLTQNGATIGHVTSSTFSPALGRPLALAMLRREHNAVGTKLESAAGPCAVVALPVTPQPAGNQQP